MADLQLTRRYKIEIGDVKLYEIFLIGCGGTGSFLALHLARLAWVMHAHGEQVKLYFIDPDIVEEGNIGRQNFCPAEIGMPKAWALMRRYNAAFGLDIQARVDTFKVEMKMETSRFSFGLIVGCVDNVAGRQMMHKVAADWMGTWWLDCGNHRDAGQVLIGNKLEQQPEISPLGFCAGTPLPSVQHPELLEDAPYSPTTTESCTELLAREVQSLMINQVVAGQAASYLYRLLVARDLDMYATYIDLVTGSMRSQFIGAE